MKNNSQPIFSVVIPVYNVERYIRTCLDSVLAQTFGSFEIICVNDGSTDNSMELVEQYNDPRIQIVHQQNQGLSAARNTGINHSCGIYIALLDSDDFWAPEKLEMHYKHFTSSPGTDVSYSASTFVDDHDDPVGIGQYPRTTNITPAHILCRNPVGNGSAAVMRRAFLMRIGKLRTRENEYRFEYFDESLRQSEDIEFWVRAALDVNARFEGIAKPLTCYRINASGLSANLDNQLDAWQRGMQNIRRQHPEFFDRWYSLAMAYQQRYLARRALQSGNAQAAFKWLRAALANDWRILAEEPARTLLTCCAALCAFLPRRMYHSLQKLAMSGIGANP